MPFSFSQQVALALVPKITGFVSVLFSLLIVATVVGDKHKRSQPYHRLLAGISCVDISSSFWLALSTWPIPSSSGALWAVGTTGSCTLQGFFTQFGITSSIYNASLSVYYLLVIKYGWREERIRKIEPLLHGIPLVWGVSTSVAGLFLTLFNNANLWCWIAPLPGNCVSDPDVECQRGAHADTYRWVLFYVPLWLMIVLVTAIVGLIFVHVRGIEKRTSHYRFAGRLDDFERQPVGRRNTQVHLRRTKEVARQCLGYAGAFYINWIALSLTRLLQAVNGQVYFGLLLVAGLTTPMQGLPNFLVYLGPRIVKLHRQRPNLSLIGLMQSSLSPVEADPQQRVRYNESSAEDDMDLSDISDDEDEPVKSHIAREMHRSSEVTG